MTYDYIIAGAGCAGLSLLYRILSDSKLSNKEILIVDKERKAQNDRTWCYWEKGSGLFEPIVRHHWKTLEFKTESFLKRFDLKQYKYKMIRGIDFYNFVLEYASKFDNVAFRTEEIKDFEVVNGKAVLKTASGTFTAEYLFNSTSLMNPEYSKEDTLLQHFMGWEIRTKEPVFDPNVGTLMDFSLSQRHGITFMYILPVSPNEALVEYTLFTGELLPKNEYKEALIQYIQNDLSLNNYDISHEEYGVIPMSLKKFPSHFQHKIINIGTAGGHTKASSGYTFQFIQKHTAKIAERLSKGKSPLVEFTFREKMFQWYDRTLIDVILSKRMTGKQIFSRMFKKVAPEKILQFLGNESGIFDDLKVMYSLPTMKFLPSGIKQLMK